jgi:hypothetical protein
MKIQLSSNLKKQSWGGGGGAVNNTTTPLQRLIVNSAQYTV